MNFEILYGNRSGIRVINTGFKFPDHRCYYKIPRQLMFNKFPEQPQLPSHLHCHHPTSTAATTTKTTHVSTFLLTLLPQPSTLPPADYHHLVPITLNATSSVTAAATTHTATATLPPTHIFTFHHAQLVTKQETLTTSENKGWFGIAVL